MSTGRQAQLSRSPAICRTYIQPNQQSAGPAQYQIGGLSPHKIMQLLHPVRDNLGLRKPGVYKISCECGRVCTGQIGRSVDVRLKEHQRHIRLEHPKKSDVAEYSLNQRHRILFHDAAILNTSARYMDGVVRKTIEVVFHPFNMN
jgi:hypothetical protein